jgi:YesN/AraC family two-component response regulator
MNMGRFKTGSSIEALKSLAVLSVEDDDEVQQQLAQFFITKVKSFYVAFNGKQGLEAYRMYRPNAVIADIRMPVMDGLEMSKVIKHIDREVPIILTTAFNDQRYLLKSNELGIDEYVLKPTNPYFLLNVLTKKIIPEISKNEAKCEGYDVIIPLVARNNGEDGIKFKKYFQHIENCYSCYESYLKRLEFDSLVHKTMIQVILPHNLRSNITNNLGKFKLK